jgi:hypothetical protein
MTPAQFDAALGAYCRSRRFHPFFIEFISGSQSLITHRWPERWTLHQSPPGRRLRGIRRRKCGVLA